jgi:tRNA modification GTPase
VMALIAAESEAGRRLAVRQLQGELSARVQAARTHAVDALVRIEASIDFPEDEVPPPEPAELAALIAASTEVVSGLLAGAEQGHILREGVRVAIVGRPNVGKSSVLNALLGVERAIVTAIPGTTRDTVEERASVAGVALHLVDTAGLTPTDDPIERIGVERSRAAAASADLLLFVVDGSVPLSELDTRAAGELAALDADGPASNPNGVGADQHQRRPVLLAVNKSDLARVVSEADAAALWPDARIVHTSAVTAGGTRELAEQIAALALGGEVRPGDALVASARHRDALRRAQDHLRAAAETLDAQTPLDFISIDLRAALEALGEITGETATVDLLDRIFAEFCIGK